MAKILINTTGSPITINDTGVTIASLTDYTIPPQDYLLWSASSDILSPVGSGDIVVNDGSDNLSPSDGIDLLKGIFPSFLVSSETIINLSMPLAGTEYSYTFGSAVRSFRFKTRNCSKLQYSTVAGQSGTNYDTIYPGAYYSVTNRKPGSTATYYFQAAGTGEVLEISYWT